MPWYYISVCIGDYYISRLKLSNKSICQTMFYNNSCGIKKLQNYLLPWDNRYYLVVDGQIQMLGLLYFTFSPLIHKCINALLITLYISMVVSINEETFSSIYFRSNFNLDFKHSDIHFYLCLLFNRPLDVIYD